MLSIHVTVNQRVLYTDGKVTVSLMELHKHDTYWFLSHFMNICKMFIIYTYIITLMLIDHANVITNVQRYFIKKIQIIFFLHLHATAIDI